MGGIAEMAFVVFEDGKSETVDHVWDKTSVKDCFVMDLVQIDVWFCILRHIPEILVIITCCKTMFVL
jgi:hypothetical protein